MDSMFFSSLPLEIFLAIISDRKAFDHFIHSEGSHSMFIRISHERMEDMTEQIIYIFNDI